MHAPLLVLLAASAQHVHALSSIGGRLREHPETHHGHKAADHGPVDVNTVLGNGEVVFPAERHLNGVDYTPEERASKCTDPKLSKKIKVAMGCSISELFPLNNATSAADDAAIQKFLNDEKKASTFDAEMMGKAKNLSLQVDKEFPAKKPKTATDKLPWNTGSMGKTVDEAQADTEDTVGEKTRGKIKRKAKPKPKGKYDGVESSDPRMIWNGYQEGATLSDDGKINRNDGEEEEAKPKPKLAKAKAKKAEPKLTDVEATDMRFPWNNGNTGEGNMAAKESEVMAKQGKKGKEKPAVEPHVADVQSQVFPWDGGIGGSGDKIEAPEEKPKAAPKLPGAAKDAIAKATAPKAPAMVKLPMPWNWGEMVKKNDLSAKMMPWRRVTQDHSFIRKPKKA